MIKERVESTRRDSVDAAMSTVGIIKESSETAQKLMMEVVGLMEAVTKGDATEEQENELESKICDVATAMTTIHTETMVGLVSISVAGFITETMRDL